ncbi:MAG: lipoyl(octanoyl) transferase LipB, partial [Phycisphaerales bacterium]
TAPSSGRWHNSFSFFAETPRNSVLKLLSLPSAVSSIVEVVDWGRLNYREAFARQNELVEQVLASRAEGEGVSGGGFLVLVEHDPVITVSRRPTAAGNVVAPAALLAREGVAVEETDRGGDVTYHGPGQLVVYPVLDLNAFSLRLHDYMRLLEDAVIEVCRGYGVAAHRDVCATGVWVGGEDNSTQHTAGQRTLGAEAGVGGENGAVCETPKTGRKICAMGVRVRRWVSLHGLALNVTTNLRHFDLIVPCGLVGRKVTSLEAEMGKDVPPMEDVKRRVTEELVVRLAARVTPADS